MARKNFGSTFADAGTMQITQGRWGGSQFAWLHSIMLIARLTFFASGGCLTLGKGLLTELGYAHIFRLRERRLRAAGTGWIWWDSQPGNLSQNDYRRAETTWHHSSPVNADASAQQLWLINTATISEFFWY